MQEKKQTNVINVRIVSPSSNMLDEEESEALIAKAEALLKKNNILFDYAPHSKSKEAFLSAKSKERAEDIMSAFSDKRINAILSSQGGDNSNDLLELLDYDLISRNNKPFFGLSDITVLLNVIALKSRITTYHGMDFLWGLGKNSTSYSESILTPLLKENKLRIIKNPNTPAWKVLKEGLAEGTILGGCLPSFCLLFGTNYDPLEMLNSPFILILEDIGQSKSEIKSRLVQIRQHKKFSLCQGIILGNFAFCEQRPEENDLSIEEISAQVFNNSKITVARIEEIGHCVENIIVPIGAKGKLECKDNKVALSFTA